MALVTGVVPGGRQVPANAAIWGASDIARQAGLYLYTRTYAAEVYDYNGDGNEDVFIPQHDPQAPSWGQPIPPAYLYTGTGTGFTQGTLAPSSDRHGCAWGDANGDGLPDLFCAVGLTASSVNELWLQQPGGGFTNVAKAAGLTSVSHGRYRTATFIDANGDGRPDIYVTRFTGPNDDQFNLSGPENPPYPNQLWINQGNVLQNGVLVPQYTLAPNSMGLNTTIGAEKDNHACNQAVDWNNDGDGQDLLVCGWHGLHLYQNNGGGGFTDVTKSLGIGGSWADAQFADLNGDGLPDLVEAQPGTVKILFQTNQHTFVTRQTFQIAYATNVAVGDFDGDGNPDIYVVGSCRAGAAASDNPDFILMNGGATSGYSFTPEEIPAVMPGGGCGNDVQPLRYQGQMDFLVLNGRRTEPGPTQLWTYTPDATNADTSAPDVLGPYNLFSTGARVPPSGYVPVQLKWFVTDQSGISSVVLQRSTDGGVTWTKAGSGAMFLHKVANLSPDGTQYQFRVQATDRDAIPQASDWFYGVPFAVGIDQDTSAKVAYSGTWSSDPLAGSSGGSVMWSATGGDTASYSAPPGTKWVAWVSTKGPDRGIATVSINGSKVGTVNLYAASEQPARVVWFRAFNSQNASNTVTVRVTGTSSAASTGTRVDIDAFLTQSAAKPWP